jgi:NAD(P)-dependent dehydrogenase (short-subunit alcohol dehydrogenase family)
MAKTVLDKFDLSGRIAVITGGAGLVGRQHTAALTQVGATCVLVDVDRNAAEAAAEQLSDQYGGRVVGIQADITSKQEIEKVLARINDEYGHVEILINNAAINPQVKRDGLKEFSRFENFLEEQWHKELAVGLTGAFLCSQVIGSEMARQKRGVILNIASDLALIAPDQRIYRIPGREKEQQPVKPVTYSVIKAGLVGLTRYLATYWADKNVRVNALSPGGIYDQQPDDFVVRLTNLIPLGRMAEKDEYQAAVIFLVSDASSYMTGTNVVMDGGRTAW